ncbi:hypothetical protein RclHR1_34650001, partial [Rhizophagus clarus]
MQLLLINTKFHNEKQTPVLRNFISSSSVKEKSQEIIPKIKNELKNLKKLKLEFGCILKSDSIKIESASTSRFMILEDQIELIELDNSIYEDVVEFNKKEDWMKEIDKFLNSEIDMNNFGSFGIDFLNAQNESEKTDKKLTYTRI